MKKIVLSLFSLCSVVFLHGADSGMPFKQALHEVAESKVSWQSHFVVLQALVKSFNMDDAQRLAEQVVDANIAGALEKTNADMPLDIDSIRQSEIARHVRVFHGCRNLYIAYVSQAPRTEQQIEGLFKLMGISNSGRIEDTGLAAVIVRN